ncbi:hypothetical protein CC86DRAFT_384534 [Ophiobolus disseminans]|uniref:Uncharacterized protein n=1 Tax=Ophiobolus disseminans TaxID=1469910 RepID=A0A6A6ZT94_9PLEO|nr:hypothetical protein CC86DRAFT_384534 [Ophiobolus disseminans]
MPVYPPSLSSSSSSVSRVSIVAPLSALPGRPQPVRTYNHEPQPRITAAHTSVPVAALESAPVTALALAPTTAIMHPAPLQPFPLPQVRRTHPSHVLVVVRPAPQDPTGPSSNSLAVAPQVVPTSMGDTQSTKKRPALVIPKPLPPRRMQPHVWANFSNRTPTVFVPTRLKRIGPLFPVTNAEDTSAHATNEEEDNSTLLS